MNTGRWDTVVARGKSGLFAAVGAWAALAGSEAGAQVDDTTWAQRVALFAYDRTAEFRVVEHRREKVGEIVVRDVTFAGVPGDATSEVKALLVVPEPAAAVAASTSPAPAAATRPGVLWVHWLGETVTSNRTQFREEAVALAHAGGAVSVLVEAMWSDPKWYGARVLEEDFARGVRQVIELRRALDLLAAQPGVDATRLVIVAHDYGAMYGALAAATDGRVRTCVWIAPTPSFNDWAFFVKQPLSRDDYLRQQQPLEIRDYLARLTGARTLLQFGGQDRYVPKAKAEELAAAVPGTKEFRFYPDAQHAMAEPVAIREERTRWLQDALVR